jgi:hypothetical protein
MNKPMNTLPGYEVESATPIPDDEDPGVGIAAGDRVVVDEEHEIYGGEEGTVQAVARGKGWYAGRIVVDVLIDGIAERFTPDELEGV